jgi:nucleotide-binding universal stress UspA family protein
MQSVRLGDADLRKDLRKDLLWHEDCPGGEHPQTPGKQRMKILIATDGSPIADDAAKLLARLPHAEPMDVTILYVNSLHDLHAGEIPTSVLAQVEEQERQRAKEATQRVESMFDGSNATVATRIVTGHPSSSIVQQASDLKADLIVMGAIGHSRLDRLLLGSTSDFVATHAPCSVLIVRPNLVEELNQHEPRICIAYDHSEPCQVAIREFSQFGWVNKKSIDIVSVVPTPFVYSDVPIQIDRSASRERAQKILNEGSELCRLVSNNITTHLIESDYIGDGLVEFATNNQSDILVLGDTGRGMMGRFFLGSVSRYVLRHANCSVWIGRLKKKA